MNSLVPPGSALLEQRAAQVCSRIGDLNVPLRYLWNPDNCPAQFLPYLAWAFSVDRWDEGWTETAKRQAVKDSFWLHRRKGTRAAVRRVIEYMNFTPSFLEWFEIGDEPGTFRLEVDVNSVGLTPKTLDELNRLIDEVKPVSRHLAQMNIATKSGGLIHTAAAMYCGDIVTVYAQGYKPDDSIRYNGVVDFGGAYYYSGD
ncbi:phage tail protein I [Erwinia sp. S38]|nr:phage tail protein I [Erwinia sp. S38]